MKAKSQYLILLLCLVLSNWGMAIEDVSALAAVAGKRVALVIGNDSYQKIKGLDNARADARAMAIALEKLGFDVMLATDVNHKTMLDTVRRFKMKLGGGDEAVFYFSGHGVQLQSGNYLLPIDIASESEDQVRDDALPLQRILDDLQEQKTRFSLAVIDACRDNPFKTGTGRSIGGRGLASTSPANGQMVIYSAGSGQKALDKLNDKDNDPNGLFTRVFLKEMVKPNVPIGQVLQNVREQVVTLAKGAGQDQFPALFDQSIGKFYFSQVVVDTPPVEAVAAPAAPIVLANVPPSVAGSFSLADIKQRQAGQVKWQAEMKAAFDETLALNAAPTLQIAAWQIFLNSYSQDNPFSNEDENLRAQAIARKKIAEKQIQDGQAAQVASLQTPPMTAPAISPVTAPVISPVVAPVIAVVSPVAAQAQPITVAPATAVAVQPVVEPVLQAASNPQPVVQPVVVAMVQSTEPVRPVENVPHVVEVLRDCPDCPEMVMVAAGSFMMGSPRTENGRFGNEAQHEVTIQQPFALGKYEVTFAEWDACVAGGGCGNYRPSDEGWGRGKQPAIQISWEDAQSYVLWLSQKTGKTYRLPTDAEWEYAARAGTTTAYPWGELPSHNQANYGTEACCDGLMSEKDVWEGSSPVGSFPANAFGLHDMQGNVWEWIEDCSDTAYTKRGLRGGSWNSYPSLLRSANRNDNTITKRPTNYGFRVARTLP